MNSKLAWLIATTCLLVIVVFIDGVTSGPSCDSTRLNSCADVIQGKTQNVSKKCCDALYNEPRNCLCEYVKSDKLKNYTSSSAATKIAKDCKSYFPTQNCTN
ncbi:hypothetical protein CASFOL_020603 [Castilleja foliolosa]|uniref:Bifunctional inhibitor/plant lipid transfer protein/seed storage helical domain-containing protein n=1 Tax=Castilleja foliolosa TaxID=1961234 RepID=A0ABD3D4Y0_9LAMI